MNDRRLVGIRQTVRRGIYLLLVLLLGVALSVQNAHLRSARGMLLPVSGTVATDAPDWIGLVKVSLGGFRGVAVSLLWFHAAMLQEQGRFVELVQLTDWITQLDPHAAEAWTYHAWNLAYNVSVMLQRPEDRLRWVRHGIWLLQDRGLRLNPREARLYRELGWLYQHKIGSTSDRAHRTFQMDLAERLAPLLTPRGGAPAAASEAARRLHDEFRLSAVRLGSLQQRFGPLDWRLPESHAVYWAVQGLELGDLREDLLLRRMIYQSLAAGVRQGRLVRFDPESGIWERAPNPDLIPGAVAFFQETYQRYPDVTIRLPFARFLVEAIRLSAAADRSADRDTLLEQLRDVMAPFPMPPLSVILADDEGVSFSEWLSRLEPDAVPSP